MMMNIYRYRRNNDSSMMMKNLGEINIRRGLPGRPTSAQWCPKGSWKNSFFDSSPTVWFRVHGLYGWGNGWMCSVAAHLHIVVECVGV